MGRTDGQTDGRDLSCGVLGRPHNTFKTLQNLNSTANYWPQQLLYFKCVFLFRKPNFTSYFILGLYRIANFTIRPNKNSSFYYSAEYE